MVELASSQAGLECGLIAHQTPAFRSSVRSEIFVENHTAKIPAPSGRHIPLLTELENIFGLGFYKYAAPMALRI